MNKSQLDALLRQRPPRASLLYGDEFLINYYSRLIALKLECDEKTSFYYDEYNAQSVNALLSQSSLFGGKSLVVLKLNSKISKKDIELFLYALEHNEQNALIIEYHQAPSKSNTDYNSDARTLAGYFKNPKMPKDSIVEVRFFEPRLDECMGFMRTRSNELGLNINERILHHILGLHNNDISLALNELEKFTIYKGRAIEPNDVDLLCDGMASFSVEELCCAIMEKKPWFKMLESMYEEGVSEITLISEIERFFYQLFLFYAYIKTRGRADAKEILGFIPPPHITQSRTKLCIKFKEAEYMKAFEILTQWRYDVSKGKAKQTMNALIKIQELLR